jgi:hypothetical protein
MNRPFLVLDSSGPLVFDGLKAVCWIVHMKSNITSPTVINISPGQLYTFVFTQNATGGYTINWPNNCTNAAPIDPEPNSTSVQNFVGNTGGVLYANIPPTGAVTP